MVKLEDTGGSTSLRDSSSSVKLLGEYIIEGFIGKGGFGEVYKAQHRLLGNHVAIKFLRPEYRDESLIGLLVREGQMLTKLHHDNIVRIWGLDIDADDRIYLVMDYMDDGDLIALLRNADSPLPVEDVERIISQVANGLHYIHQQNIIHRDLKPENILRDKKGRIVITDFGLAKVRDSTLSRATQLTTMARAGTPAYMAPEHWDGKAEYRSDLYSLGIITYLLLTNHLPFTGSEAQMEKGHRQNVPPSLREFNSKLTPEIEQVVLKMLEKAPEKRYQTALDFARDLRRAITQKTLKALRTDPQRFDDDLVVIAEGGVMRLGAGDYHGPFTLDKRLHLIGAGPSTRLYAVDDKVLDIQVSGVQLENMVIERTPESNEEAIKAGEQISYVLRHVTIKGGEAREARWEDAEWQLPVGGIDFGRMPVESQQLREVQIEVKEWCTLTVRSNLPGLEVFPTRLSPGPHTLRLVFHANELREVPPGTHLDGVVRLQGESESREIHVVGQLEQPVMQPVPEPSPQEEVVQSNSEAWPFQLWDEPARRLLSELGDPEGKRLATIWSADRRNQKLKRLMLDKAASLLHEMFGEKACRWQVRRLRINEKEQYSDEEVWELMLALNSPNFPPILVERKKTLCLECKVLRDGKGSLKISKISVLGRDKGAENLATLPILVRLTTFVREYPGISPEIMQKIQDLPIKSAEELDVDQLQGWQVLLEFESEQIKKRQYWVGYNMHTYSEGASKVIFFLDKDNTRNSTQELIAYEEFRVLAGNSRKELLKIFATLPSMNKARKRQSKDVVGSLESFNAERGTFEIKLEQKMKARLRDGGYALPKEGYLYFEAGGDVAQNDQHQKALDILKQGRATNPLLGDFFFDARKARPIEAVQLLQSGDLLSGTCNRGQIAAIEAALSTRDLLLIQGPPGTGKTTVIAEICYQVALQGGRTLVASQSNLAVDNALARIIHHPRVRALRKGNLETVEDEGRDYTEEYVVQKWLSNTANDCQNRLQKRQKNIELFQRLVGVTERFTRYRANEADWENKRLSLQMMRPRISQQISEVTASIAHDEAEVQQYVPVQQTLKYGIRPKAMSR